MYLVVNVDDIVITRTNVIISQLKKHSLCHFQTKGHGFLKYFIGIEVVRSKEGIVISQGKYALHTLEKMGKIECRL